LAASAVEQIPDILALELVGSQSPILANMNHLMCQHSGHMNPISWVAIVGEADNVSIGCEAVGMSSSSAVELTEFDINPVEVTPRKDTCTDQETFIGMDKLF
jgi:hypothetical protein